MTIANGYATLNDYKAWIAVRGLAGSVGTDTSDDAVIESLIEGASRYIDHKTARRFYVDSTDKTRYYTPDEKKFLKIDDLSASPTSVSVDYTGEGTYTAIVEGTDFVLAPRNALLDGMAYNWIKILPVSSAYFPLIIDSVKVIGKFGFAAVPADIKEACLTIVQGAYSMRSGQASNGRITVTQAGVAIFPEEVSPMAMATIDAYMYKY